MSNAFKICLLSTWHDPSWAISVTRTSKYSPLSPDPDVVEWEEAPSAGQLMNGALTLSVLFFLECVARVPLSLGGLGVRLCSPSFAFSVATVRNRRQVSATVCGDAVRLSTEPSVSGVVPKACQVESWRRSYIGVCRGGVCESDLWRRSYIGVCRGGVCESDLCRRSYIGVCRGGVCGSDLWRRSYIGVCRGGVCESDLCRRGYIGACRGGVWETYLWRRSYIGVCRGGVCVSDLWRRSYMGVCRGGVCVSDLCRRSFIGVCRGGVCESDLCQVRVSYNSVK